MLADDDQDRPSRSPDRTARVEPEVEIIVHRLHELHHLVLEEMVRAGDRVVVDGDVALGPELVDELLDRPRSHHFVRIALDDPAAAGDLSSGLSAKVTVDTGRQSNLLGVLAWAGQ